MQEISEYLKKTSVLIDSRIKKYLPERIGNKWLRWAFGRPKYSWDFTALNKTLADPIWDFLKRGGKRWRPALFLLIGEALGQKTSKIVDFALIPELAHNGSIMVDDIEDLSEMRRGKPCTHKLFGLDVAINAGNFMYFLPLLIFFKKADKFDCKTLLRAYEAWSQEMIAIHTGQAMDIWWHKGAVNNISEQQYLQMCAYKTGALARLAARLAVILSGGSKEQEEKMGIVAETMGIAFQIQDDILSATSKQFASKKGFGDDITEGKRTLLVINTLRSASEKDKHKLIQILNSHTRDPKLIHAALNILKKYKSINYARTLAQKLVDKAWSEAEPLLPQTKAKRLKNFINFLIKRKI